MNNQRFSNQPLQMFHHILWTNPKKPQGCGHLMLLQSFVQRWSYENKKPCAGMRQFAERLTEYASIAENLN